MKFMNSPFKYNPINALKKLFESNKLNNISNDIVNDYVTHKSINHAILQYNNMANKISHDEQLIMSKRDILIKKLYDFCTHNELVNNANDTVPNANDIVVPNANDIVVPNANDILVVDTNNITQIDTINTINTIDTINDPDDTYYAVNNMHNYIIDDDIDNVDNKVNNDTIDSNIVNINTGNKWTKDEMNTLVREIEKNLSLSEIASIHKRSKGGIQAKIIQLSKSNNICKQYIIVNSLRDRYAYKNTVKSNINIEKEMIYILQLENNKYYVGWTKRCDGERFDEHFSGIGYEWTKKYKPIQVLKWIDGTKQDEDKITLELMKEFGWYNVRGGKWCKVVMTSPPNELNTTPQKIQTVINNAVKSTHKYTKPYVNNKEWKCSYCDKTFDTRNGTLYHENKFCKNKYKKKYNN